MSFSDLKNKSKLNFDMLSKQLKQMKNGVKYDQDGFWKITRDASGNGQAIIRFLSAPEGEEFPFVQIWSHNFQGPKGKWYIENSRTTLGPNNPDPVSEYNTELWNTGIEANKQRARIQKRKLAYISNILVIKDFAKPENNGKVFLYKYGSKIFEKIKDAINPPFEGDRKFNPFDMFAGAELNLKVKTVDKYPNYDKSEWGRNGKMFESDEEIKETWLKAKSLAEFVSPDKFKSYDELKRHLYDVLEIKPSNSTLKEPMMEQPRQHIGKIIEDDMPFEDADDDDETPLNDEYLETDNSSEEDDFIKNLGLNKDDLEGFK